MVRSGTPLMVVGSLAELSLVSISPVVETDAVLVTLKGAFEATLTSNVKDEFAPAPSTVLRVQVTT
jgi:hypothetical protein